jgi:dihydroorotate dehydrogenase
VNKYLFFRNLLFKLDPETAHRATLRLIRLAGSIQPLDMLLRAIYAAPQRPVQAFGLHFSNPLGLAAGYDKDGLAWRGLACLGFSHIEVGTVTPKPQPGNPLPRLFRLPAEQALINCMGFPGRGGDFVLHQISKPRPKNLVLGVNIGKNKDTPLEKAVDDYLYLMRVFHSLADYLVVNVSSPNTVGLRQLQGRQALDSLLTQLTHERELLRPPGSSSIPILVKLAPDLSDSELEDALDVSMANGMDGIVATNTTLSRDNINSALSHKAGGLSGKPLFQRSLAMVEKIYKWTNGKIPIIGVGGIDSTTGVQKMLDAGARLVQIYTGLIYEGPGLVRRILRELPNTTTTAASLL